MRKICAVITARPSYARIKSVLEALRSRNDVELHIVLAASALLDRYGYLVDILKKDGFTPSATVYMLLEGENLITSAKSTGMGIVELASVFDRIRPDVVISVADRYETIATAIAGSYLNIPVCHIQGGEITGSIDEKVRHAVTKLSNVHMVSNDSAARRVIAMGEDPKTVHVTGCPSIDLARRIADEPLGRYSVEDIIRDAGVGHRPNGEKGFVIVIQHPVTTRFSVADQEIMATIEAMERFDLPVIWFWPNVDAGSDILSKALRRLRELKDPEKILFLKNLPPEEFLRLLVRSRAIIGNSSAGIRECAFLGIPAVNVGDRQNSRDRAENVIDVPASSDDIRKAAKHQAGVGRYASSNLYGDGMSGEKIAHLLASVELTIEKRLMI